MVDGGGGGELLVKSRTPENISFGNKNRMWLLWKYVERMKEKKQRMDDNADQIERVERRAEALTPSVN